MPHLALCVQFIDKELIERIFIHEYIHHCQVHFALAFHVKSHNCRSTVIDNRADGTADNASMSNENPLITIFHHIYPGYEYVQHVYNIIMKYHAK